MLTRLHHIGMAVPDLERAIAAYRDRSGCRVSAPRPLPGTDYLLAYVETGGTQIELVQPGGAPSAAQRFLAAHPDGGIYHLGYEVADVVAAAAELQRQGATMLGDGVPRVEPDGTLVLVLDATPTHATVIELRQPA